MTTKADDDAKAAPKARSAKGTFLPGDPGPKRKIDIPDGPHTLPQVRAMVLQYLPLAISACHEVLTAGKGAHYRDKLQAAGLLFKYGVPPLQEVEVDNSGLEDLVKTLRRKPLALVPEALKADDEPKKQEG